MQKPFKAQSTQPDMVQCQFIDNFTLKYRFTAKSMQPTTYKSELHGKLNTWEKSSTFKGKCVVNAVNFICNLHTGPLIKIIKIIK